MVLWQKTYSIFRNCNFGKTLNSKNPPHPPFSKGELFASFLSKKGIIPPILLYKRLVYSFPSFRKGGRGDLRTPI
ncbi:MAG: hypothetical protein A2149_09450 [Candidatus Schekmanbacteria bacterium RBG_16_38_11]|uniref:Uncharacterized protein n=1 Tax=Candidatus Schekmanbacteria bacterium RBG_16_38_11 TaxID=1817880 RepID=A0A1F7RVB8_9BACT|nr:MAG: hypothetical protein A2149_09450 [Candidatus Schekmanbacteria bacterium RBG_16_38_11]